MGRELNGVLGPIRTEDLGYTLIHEHVVTCCDWSLRMTLGSLYFEEEAMMEMALKQLKKAKSTGISTIVDGTPLNLGRDIRLIRKAAELSGVNVLASSGFYHQPNPILATKPAGQLTDLLLRDCGEGMTGTDIKPAILKAAVDYMGFTDYIEKLLNVVGAVSAKLSLPVFCHTIPELRQGSEMLDIFESCGVPPSAVIAGHSGDVDDIDYLISILKRGCYLGMDRFGIQTATPGTSLERRCWTIAELCSRGWGDKLLIGHDYAVYSGFFESWEDSLRPEFLEKDVEWTYYERRAVPILRAAGLGPEELHKLVVDNPRRFFEQAYA